VKGVKGEVVCLGERYVIVRAKIKKQGGRAYTPSGKYIGRIIRVFGPIERPYVKIKIERKWGRQVSEIVLRGDRSGRKK